MRMIDINDFLFFQTYYNNQHRQEDKEVYCCSHVPRIGPGHLDNSSVGIRSALNVPRSANFVNEQIRGHHRASFETDGEFLRFLVHIIVVTVAKFSHEFFTCNGPCCIQCMSSHVFSLFFATFLNHNGTFTELF